MNDTSHDDLLGRVAMLEFLLIQQAALSGASAESIEAHFAALRESAASRIQHLPEASRPAAERSLDAVLSSACQTAKDLAEFRSKPNGGGAK